MLTPMAWAFTRISVLGVCRYLGNVDEVNSPRFLFLSIFHMTLGLNKAKNIFINSKQSIIMNKTLRLLSLLTVFLLAVGYASAKNGNITFADANVKTICVNNWDTNGDGELSYEEAAAVTSIAYKFSNKYIKSFDELKYFTGLTSIYQAFNGCSYLTSVTIPESVTSIDYIAFLSCTRLVSVKLPKGLTTIGEWAFSGCSSLTSITIPEGVTTIGDYAFNSCDGLKSVISLIEEPFEIPSHVFLNTSATLYVPAGTKSLYEATPSWNQFQRIVEDDGTFIMFADGNVKAICVENWDADGDGELSYDEAAAVTDLGNVFQDNLSITSFDELQYFTGVTSIGESAFMNCMGLKSVIIGEGVKSIGKEAFYWCRSLSSVIIGESVTTIGDYAFGGCSLSSITIPSSVTSIGKLSFPVNSLTSIMVDDDNKVYDSRNDCNAIIETASNSLIEGCENTIIPESVTSIGDYAFSGVNGLTSVTIPEGVATIGRNAFSYCENLTSVTIPEGVTTIGNQAFFYCFSLASVTIPSSVTSIGDYAFENSGLTNVTILEGVTSIGREAFRACSYLTSVTIPSSVTSIGDAAFNKCSSLTSITVDDRNEVYDSRNDCNAIIETASNSLIEGCKNTIIPESVTSIGDYAFEECRGLTSVTIPSSVKSIGNYAFYRCTGLTTVTSLIEEPFEITEDVFMDYDASWNPVFTSATLYVPAGTKSLYEAMPAWNQFQNIVEMDIEPMEDGETVDFGSDIDENTDLDGSVVGDILYSISSGDGSYDPAEGCIVVTTPTDDSVIDGQDIFGEDFQAGYTGIVFKVAEGKGTVKIEAQTTGTMVLKVKIGNNEPVTMELEGKLKVSFPYNVTEPTYVYIYGGSKTAQTVGMRHAPADGALKIYSIEVESVSDGIGTIQADEDDNAPVYNLNGQRVNTPRKGIYIKKGKKVLVK